MGKAMRFIPSLLSLIFLLPFLPGCREGHTAVSFPNASTGIPVAAEFAAYYEANGGARVFGYPITAAFYPQPGSPLVQYFQTMRLDYDGAVRPYPLGEWAFPGMAQLEPAAVSENGRARIVPGSPYPIQDEFLAFYEKYNGEQLLGVPLSPQVTEAGLRVQYFENARLEWRPELPQAQRVQLSILGQNHFDAEMAFTYRREVARPISSAGITAVQVMAAARYPVLYAGEKQILYATAQTSDGRPVSNIRLIATLVFDDEQVELEMGVTDESGQAQLALDFGAIPPGKEVQVHITAVRSDGQEVGRRMLVFRTWW